MDRTDKRALVIFFVALLALLGLVMWGGSCLGESRARKQYEEANVQSVPKASLDSLNSQISQLQTASASLQKDNEDLRTRLDSVKADLSKSQSESASLQKDNEALKAGLQSAQADLSKLQSSSASLQEDNDKLRPQLESLRAELSQAQSRINALQQDGAALQTQLASARSELAQMQSRYNSLQDTDTTLRAQLASAQSQLSQGQSAQTALQQENTGLRAQLAQWYAWLRNSPPPPTINTPTPGPSITLSPASGPAGTVITVTGSGFVANTLGNVFIDVNGNGSFEQGEPIQYLTTSATGAFTAAMSLPLSPPVPPGPRQVLAVFPMGLPPQAAATFTVTAAGQ